MSTTNSIFLADTHSHSPAATHPFGPTPFTWRTPSNFKTPAPTPVLVITSEVSLARQIEASLRYSGDFQFLGGAPNASEFPTVSGRGQKLISLLDLGSENAVVHFHQIKARFNHARSLLLCHSRHEQLAIDLLMAGADGCLDLATQADAIVEALREVLKGGAPLPPKVAAALLHLSRKHALTHTDCPNLTKREFQVIQHLSRGATYKEIAASLHLSIDTIRSHVTNLYKKLGVRSRTEAVVKHLHGRQKLE